jgi:hypothetical protein
MALSRGGAGRVRLSRWRRGLVAATSSLSLGLGVVALGGAVGGAAAGAATPVIAHGTQGGSEVTVQLGGAFFITLLPPDPCSPAQVAAFGCIDVVPGVLQVFGLGPAHLAPVLPISVAINNQYEVTLFPPGSCSIGSGLALCRDVIPGVVQTLGIAALPSL